MIPLPRPAPTNPAERVIYAIGGVRATARVIGRSSSSVSRWQKPRDQGGTGGRVPSSCQGKILAYARANGLKLTADDLIA